MQNPRPPSRSYSASGEGDEQGLDRPGEASAVDTEEGGSMAPERMTLRDVPAAEAARPDLPDMTADGLTRWKRKSGGRPRMFRPI